MTMTTAADPLPAAHEVEATNQQARPSKVRGIPVMVTVVQVIDDRTVECATAAHADMPFTLPLKEHVRWCGRVKPGRILRVVVPYWLANRHRQIVGDERFEAAKEWRRAQRLRRRSQTRSEAPPS